MLLIVGWLFIVKLYCWLLFVVSLAVVGYVSYTLQLLTVDKEACWLLQTFILATIDYSWLLLIYSYIFLATNYSSQYR